MKKNPQSGKPIVKVRCFVLMTFKGKLTHLFVNTILMLWIETLFSIPILLFWFGFFPINFQTLISVITTMSYP